MIIIARPRANCKPYFQKISKFFPCGIPVALRGKIVYTEGGNVPQEKRFLKMLTLRGIITLLVLAVLFALAVVWISKNGGWKGEGCGGNCASCHSRCENPEHKKP